MKLRIEKSVTVLTPSIGSAKLVDAVDSVRTQTYGNITHLVVGDGTDSKFYIERIIYDMMERQPQPNVDVAILPYNTGGSGFYGHRIYAAFPHLINSDYIFFLDEDNWYEPDHVRSLVETIEKDNLDFAYSLRSIYLADKTFVDHDNCESLGKWPVWFSRDKDPHYLIDTSSFAFTRQFIVEHCHLWHWGWGGDRHFLYGILPHEPKYDTNGKHTLNYRLDGNPGSVGPEFFRQGNLNQVTHYKGNYPWSK